MAEVLTLTDVVHQLKESNKNTDIVADASMEIMESIDNIANSFSDMLKQQATDRLKNLEKLRESKGKKVTLGDKGPIDTKGVGFWDIFDVDLHKAFGTLTGSILGTISASILAVLGATGFEKSLFAKVGNWVSNLKVGLLKVFGFTDDVLDTIKIAAHDLKSSNVLVGFREKVGYAVIKLKDLFSTILKPFTWITTKLRIPEALTATANFFKGGMIAGFFKGVGKILKPIAVIFSIFDGLKVAAADMEGKEGFVEKWIQGGLGGFLKGSLGSFFGEMFNFIKTIPLFIIKKLFPGIVDKDGKFIQDSFIGKVLGKIDSWDFNKMIQGLVEAVFHPIMTIKKAIRGFGKMINKALGTDFDWFPEIEEYNFKQRIKGLSEEDKEKATKLWKNQQRTKESYEKHGGGQRKQNFQQVTTKLNTFLKEKETVKVEKTVTPVETRQLGTDNTIRSLQAMITAQSLSLEGAYKRNDTKAINALNTKILENSDKLNKVIDEKKMLDSQKNSGSNGGSVVVSDNSSKNVTYDIKNINSQIGSKGDNLEVNLGGN